MNKCICTGLKVRCWQHKLLILDGNLDIHVPTLKTKPIFLVYWTPNNLFISLFAFVMEDQHFFRSKRGNITHGKEISIHTLYVHTFVAKYTQMLCDLAETHKFTLYLFFSFHSHISFAMVYCHIFYPVWRHRVLYASSGYISAPSLKSVDHSL